VKLSTNQIALRPRESPVRSIVRTGGFPGTLRIPRKASAGSGSSVCTPLNSLRPVGGDFARLPPIECDSHGQKRSTHLARPPDTPRRLPAGTFAPSFKEEINW